MKGKKSKVLSLALSAAMVMTMVTPAYAETPATAAPADTAVETTANALSLQNVESIQAFTGATYYGTGLTSVEITYKDGVDVSGATAEDYILTDRGSLNPDFGELTISSVSVDGQVVTLGIEDNTDATENNKMVYTGTNKEGSRERNAFGIYCTGAWYRDADGTLYYGSDDTDEYANNTTGRGYQARECLELKLQVVGEDEVESLANDKGQYNADSKWLETVDTQFGEDGFQSLYDLQIESTGKDGDWSETNSAADDYVRGYYYVPEDYDPANGIVFTLQGQGISYWKLADGSDNDGTGIMYDNATASWANKGAIVVNIHDRSSQQTLADSYDFVLDDVNVMKYFIEKYDITGSIVIQGNSRGTMASDIVIKALAGCAYNPAQQGMGVACEMDRTLDKSVYDFEIDTYICQNGTMGGNMWTDADMKTIAATGLRVWAFDGEQDSNNIDNIANYKATLKSVGYDDEWIEENVRLTGLASELTAYWGESDHSATRTNGWYFSNAAYYGSDLTIDENGEIVYNTELEDGDTYTLKGRGTAGESNKAGYEYTVYDDLYQVWAFESVDKINPVETPEITGSLDEIAVPELDDSVANRLPMTGYFTKTINGDRTMKVYLADGIHVRDYYTVIAVPDGVDTDVFLAQNGWFDIADENQEGLIILEPGEGGWGTAEEEASYINAAISFYSGNGYFSVFGEHYLVGYGAGAPALEYWAAANPLKVIAQVYVDSEGLDAEYLNAMGATQFATKCGAYNQVYFPEGFELLTYADAVVPTWYIGNAPEDSLTYWKAVNDTEAEATADDVFGMVYAQDPDSDNWCTDYSGAISKVAVKEGTASTADICSFMYYYTRYENSFVYGNQLSVRATYENAHFYTVEVNGHPREYFVYTPDTMVENAPVVMVWPGNTQSDYVFSDATQWLEVAEDEGFMLVMMCEDYATSTTFTHKDSEEFYEAAIEKIEEDYAGQIDTTRIYGTGQSLGSMTTQGWVSTNPEYYAATASTSGGLMESTKEANGLTDEYQALYDQRSYAEAPTYMIYGQGDLGMLEGTLWDDIDNSLDTWAEYVLEANGLDFAAVGENDYTTKSLDSFGHKTLHTWTWTKTVNGVEIPVVQLSENMVRAHNCISAEMPELWNYMKHFSMDAEGNRYYSESAFAKDDAVCFVSAAKNNAPAIDGSLDEMAIPELDNSVANQLPMTGYYTKTINGNRTMKVYLAEGIHIRDYYTIIAVPDGVDTEEFLSENGWYDVADQNQEGLIILEPGEGGWGTAEEEASYINAAISFYSGNGYFSVFGENYLVGYGAGAPALEYWAAANPLKVIAQVYVDSEGLDAEYLNAMGATQFATKCGAYNQVYFPEGFELLTYADAVAPTWFIGNAPEDSLTYWKAVNDTVATGKADDVFGTVFAQDPESDNWNTDYSGAISKVAVKDGSASTADICEFMYYYTRYENSFVYGNQLSERASFDNAEFYTVEVNGHPREYYVYTPDNMMKNTPVVMVWPGNTQSDRVFADATQWNDVAEKYGFMLVMMCEDYNTSTTFTHKDSEAFEEAAIAKIKADYAGQIDETRIYGTGQSLGSMTTQGWVSTHPEYYAAVASTSGPLMESVTGVGYDERSYKTVPTYMIYGQGDLEMLQGTLWDDIDNSLDTWAEYVLEANGLDFAAVGENDYTTKALDSFGHKNLHTWTWTKTIEGVEVPLVQLSEDMVRAHNCISAEMPELWNYMKHFSMDADGTRYYSASAFAQDDAVVINKGEQLQDEVVDVKATVAPNFYGQKVSTVVITFDEDVDAEALAEADITVYDRGSATPEFGALKVVDKKIEGNVVTLTMNTDTDKLTDRSRNTFGNLTCTGWYMDSEGNIYCNSLAGTTDAFGNEIYANTAGKTCQKRNLDLVLCVNTEITQGIKSTDTKGNWANSDVWEPIELTGGMELVEQEFVNIGAPAEGYTQVSENGEVPVQVIWPENYDVNRAEAYPVIVYQCGGGVCYWEVAAGENGSIAAANNLGTNTVYDNMMTSWHKAYPDAIVMAVNVHSSNTEVAAAEINGVLRYANENWNAAAGKAILVGNSQGTIIGSDAIRQAPELFAGYVECNGNFGSMGSLTTADGTKANSSFSAWSDEDFANMIANPVAVWMFNGETDGTNAGVAQDTYAVLKDAYMAAGRSETWVYNNIRLSGLQSWKFKAWGETDHSVTKVVADNYIENPYTDVYVNATLQPGDTYKFTGAEAYQYYAYTMDFDYTVYAESVAEWAKALVAGEYDEEIVTPQPAEKAAQTITAGSATTIRKVYGDAAFDLNAITTGDGALTYTSSKEKVATVDENGIVTINGAGQSTITITAAETENYKAATYTVLVKVSPKKAKVVAAVAKKNAVKVYLQKDSKASGYQIQVSTSVNFSASKTVTVTLDKKSTVATTIKNLQGGKTYYVRARSYKAFCGYKLYSAYSNVKVVKTAK